MKDIKRILVPTDFSACANYAVEMAMSIAKQTGASIYFLHLSIGDAGPSHVPGKVAIKDGAELKDANYTLSNLVRQAEEQGIKAHQELILGNGQERIEDYITPLKIDLLVMGSHGSTGIRELVIGSKTQHVIRNISIPSLVVKQKQRKNKIENIVFASTFKKDTSQALETVVGFCKVWGAKLNLLFLNLLNHLIEENIANQMMYKQMKKYGDINYSVNITETNDKEFGITQFAKQINADLIVVPMASKSVLGRIFNPDLAVQLINHSALPVLVVRASR